MIFIRREILFKIQQLVWRTCRMYQAKGNITGQQYLKNSLQSYQFASNLQFNERINDLKEKGQKIFHLGFGQSPFPVPTHAEQVLKENAGRAEYFPVKGILELRKAIIDFHAKQDGLHQFTQENCVVGPGSKELIFLLMSVIGGDVLLLSPTWTTYKPQAVLSNHKVFIIPTSYDEHWKLTPAMIEKVYSENTIKENSLLIFCNPDNPTGSSYTKDELIALGSEMRKRKMLVLSDEIYGRLSFNDNHLSLAQFYPEGTILSCGISKWASCGGWRLGYHLYPSHLKDICNVVAGAASNTYTSASAPIQLAAVSLLKYDERSQNYVKHCKRILHTVATFCCKKLSSCGVKVHSPSSGYYIFPDFEVIRAQLKKRGITTGTGMCDALLEEAGIALMSGGPAYLHPLDQLTVRLCYINFDGTKALKASEAIGLGEHLPESFVETECSETYQAINLLHNWVEKQKKL
ncbi:asparagine--oxo-acid transaminase-like [Ciona intestinalis]